MGLAVAEAAAGAGHEVTLLLGPVLLGPGLDERVRVVRFNTTAELAGLLGEHWPGHDVLVMAAAVADYRLAQADAGQASGKRERCGGLTLRLEPTPDLVAAAASGKRADQRVVAFALEEQDQLEERAVLKMRSKRVDAVVANPLTTMDAERVDAVWLRADGLREQPGGMGKAGFAAWLIGRVEGLWG